MRSSFPRPCHGQHFMRYIVLALLLSVTIGCSRDAGEKSVVTIQFPESVVSEKSIVGTASVGEPAGEWGYAAPTALSGIRCYGLAISGVENKNSKKCGTAGVTLFETQDLVAAVAAGQEISIEVQSGKKRDIKIFGFAAASLDDCTRFSEKVPMGKLSRPFLLSEKTVDLEPGTTTLPMPMVFNADKSFDYCTGSFGDEDQVPVLLAELSTPIAGSTHTFPNLTVGNTSPLEIEITNTGAGTATSMSGITLAPPFRYSGGGGYPGLDGTCTGTLAPEQTCTVSVEYEPVGPGTFNSSLDISYQDGSGTPKTMSISLSGTVTPGVLTYTGSYNFPNTTTANVSSPVTLTYTVTGGAAINLATPTVSNAVFSVLSNECVGSMLPGNSCNISLTFTPSIATLYTGVLNMEYDNGLVTMALPAVPISGMGRTPAYLNPVSPINFGSPIVNQQALQTFTLQNAGDTPINGLVISTLNLTGSITFSLLSTTCGASLGAQQGCSVTIRYIPTSVDNYAATFSLEYQTGNGPSNIVIPLAGAATAP